MTTYTVAEPSRDGCTTVQEVSLDTRGHSIKESGPDYSGTEVMADFGQTDFGQTDFGQF